MTTSEHADNAAEAFVCEEGEHHWVSSHEPHAPIWIIRCSVCGRHNFTEMLAALASTPSPAQPTEASEASERDILARTLAASNGTPWDFVEGGADDNDPYYRDADTILDAGFRLAPSPVQVADDRLAILEEAAQTADQVAKRWRDRQAEEAEEGNPSYAIGLAANAYGAERAASAIRSLAAPLDGDVEA